jgi:tetratricopeptide (TPR) repeat protein
MYSVLLSVAIGLLFGIGGWLLQWWGLGWALVFAIVVTVVAWVVTARRIGKRLQPIMGRLQKQLEQGMVTAAKQSLQEMHEQGKWMPMLRGQVTAQLGMLEYQTGDPQKAMALLRQAPRRLADAQLVLAVMQYRNGDKAAAFSTLQFASLANKKHSMLHNAYAWLLHKEGRADEAIAVLARYTKKVAIDEVAKNNMLRLQNGNKPTMKSFDLPWYALQLERPPADMGQLRQGRKGFRQPPMRRGS